MLVNSRRPSGPFSTPMPDCLWPPNGMSMPWTWISLTHTVPVSSRRATSCGLRWGSPHRTTEPEPGVVGLGDGVVDVGVQDSGRTGPNGSSWTMRLSSGGLSTTVSGTKLPGRGVVDVAAERDVVAVLRDVGEQVEQLAVLHLCSGSGRGRCRDPGRCRPSCLLATRRTRRRNCRCRCCRARRAA